MSADAQNRRQRLAAIGVAVALLVALDQWTKYKIITHFEPGESVGLLPPIFFLTYVQNTGAAFGLFKGQVGLFVIFAVVMIAWMLWSCFSRPPQQKFLWGSVLVLGGAIGNLIDRLRLGYVVDFLDLRVWPVFNIADSAITIGVGLLIWYSFSAKEFSQEA